MRLSEGWRESYCCSYRTVRFVAFQGNHLALGFPHFPGHREVLGQSLICSLVNTEGLSCGKQVCKFSCFYQRWENIQAAPDSTSFPHRHSGSGIPHWSITTKTHSTSQHLCPEQPPPPPPLIACVPAAYLASSLAELPEKGDTVQSLGKADTDFSLSLQLPVHKRAPAGIQTLVPEHVSGTCVPLDGMAVVPELCRVLAGNGSGAGMCLVGVGQKVALGEQHNDEVAVRTRVLILSPLSSLLFSCSSPNLRFISLSHRAFHSLLATGKQHPRSKSLTLHAVKIITVLLLKTWLWVLKSPIHQPCLPTDHFCHHPRPHCSCKRCWWQNSNPNIWDTSHALPIFPFTAWSWLCISAPCQRSREKFVSIHLQDKSYSFLVPFHLLNKSSPLPPPVSGESKDPPEFSPPSPAATTWCTSSCGFPWEGSRYWLCYQPTNLSQLPLCLCLLPASLSTPGHCITGALFLCHLHTPQPPGQRGAEEAWNIVGSGGKEKTCFFLLSPTWGFHWKGWGHKTELQIESPLEDVRTQRIEESGWKGKLFLHPLILLSLDLRGFCHKGISKSSLSCTGERKCMRSP